MDPLEQRAHLVLRGDERAAQLPERLALRRERGIPEHVGDQAGDQALAAFTEELAAGSDLPTGLAVYSAGGFSSPS
jgi:hypothetical protein